MINYLPLKHFEKGLSISCLSNGKVLNSISNIGPSSCSIICVCVFAGNTCEVPYDGCAVLSSPQFRMQADWHADGLISHVDPISHSYSIASVTESMPSESICFLFLPVHSFPERGIFLCVTLCLPSYRFPLPNLACRLIKSLFC